MFSLNIIFGHLTFAVGAVSKIRIHEGFVVSRESEFSFPHHLQLVRGHDARGNLAIFCGATLIAEK